MAPPRVLLLALAEEIRGKADLGLHLFFAVADIIVGDERDDRAAGIAGGELEGGAVVVEFVGLLPAHAVAALAGRGLRPARQPEFPFGQPGQMGRENDATGVAGPVLGIEGRVVFRQVRIAGIAEDAFDEIEVGDKGAGDEEAGLHRALRGETRHGGAHDGPQVERDETPGGRGGRGGERQPEQVGGRMEGVVQQPPEDGGWHGLLVVGHRQAERGDMKDALRGAPVAARVVQHALAHAIGRKDVAPVAVGIGWEREQSREADAVEHERGGGHAGDIGLTVELLIDEILDPLVDRAEMARQGAVFFAAEGEEVIDQRRESVRLGRGDPGLADFTQLEVEVGDELSVGIAG